MSRIYVVEDDENISALIAAVLSAAGHDVRAMDSGAALERLIASGELPELLLLDIMLPGKDGLTLLSEWKARPSTAAIPVIILSAKGEELDKVRGLELGAEDYVTKPFGVLELQARVKTALRRVPAATGAARLGNNEIDFGRREVWRDGHEVKLTFKEFELLEYMYKKCRAGAQPRPAAHTGMGLQLRGRHHAHGRLPCALAAPEAGRQRRQTPLHTDRARLRLQAQQG